MAGFTESGDMRTKEKTQKALSDFLRPEFLNRVDEIITFRALDLEDFKRIAAIMLEDLKKSLAEKYIRFHYTDAAAAYIAKQSFSVKYGARNMRRYIQTAVEDQAAEKIVALRGQLSAISVDVGVDRDSLSVTAI